MFITAHPAFQLWFERSLRSIDPELPSSPYWDFMIDSAAYGGDWARESPIFQDTWWGKVRCAPVRPSARPGGGPSGRRRRARLQTPRRASSKERASDRQPAFDARAPPGRRSRWGWAHSAGGLLVLARARRTRHGVR